MIRSSMKLLACLAALSAAACATAAEDEPPVDEGPGAEIPGPEGDAVPYLGCIAPGCSEQGRHLLSAVFDVPTSAISSTYLSFPQQGTSGTAKVLLKVMGSALVRKNGGALPLPLTITGSEGVLEIQSVVAAPPGEPTPQYLLAYTPNGGGTTDNPCVNDLAIVVDGAFDDEGHHDEASVGGLMSFACKDEGVAYKCVHWKYPPGSDPMADGWRAHQACTRAARNDYCKNGVPHTLDDTYVRIWDDYDVPALGFPHWPPRFQGLNQWPPPVNVFKFESVWPEEETLPPTCLSKERWQGLQPGELDTCDVHPGDPRTDRSATFCENTVPDTTSHAIVFESKYTDLLLEEWQEGDDHAVSVTGYHPGADQFVPGKRPFGATTGWTHVQTLGTLLRSLPGSIEESQVTKVYTYDDGGTDHVLAGPTGSPWIPPFNGAMTWEGMVFKQPPEGGIPATAELHAYESDATGDFYNGTEKADPDDTDHGLIGYIMVPAQ
jgi:hypothetical protein